MYTIKDGEKKGRLEAYDRDNNLVGEAVFAPFKSSDIFEKPRLNIYFDIAVKDVADKEAIKDQMFDEIMKRGRAVKEENKDIDVKIYHCCFSDNKENIAYYSSKEGFKYDEGMFIVRKEVTEEQFEIADIHGIEFAKLLLEDEGELLQLVEEQNKVFLPGYTVEELKQLKNENQWFSIAAKHKGKIIGNIIFIVKEDEPNIKYGWVDDLFVSKEWRKYGIARNLVLKGLEELNALNVKESRLEVWSSNERAMSLYSSVGYKFHEETESSIGMLL